MPERSPFISVETWIIFPSLAKIFISIANILQVAMEILQARMIITLEVKLIIF